VTRNLRTTQVQQISHAASSRPKYDKVLGVPTLSFCACVAVRHRAVGRRASLHLAL